MKNVPDAELLFDMSYQESDPEDARRAFAEFYRRHKDYVWKMAYVKAKDIDSQNTQLLASDFHREIFLKVFHSHESKGAFDPDKVNDASAGIKRWLAGIAKNVLRDHLKRIKSSQHTFISNSAGGEDDLPFFDSIPGEALTPRQTPKLKDLQGALSSLKPRNREILVLSLEFQEEGQLPNWLREDLCGRYNISDDTLRQARKRAAAKILVYLKKLGYEVPSIIDIFNTPTYLSNG